MGGARPYPVGTEGRDDVPVGGGVAVGAARPAAGVTELAQKPAEGPQRRAQRRHLPPLPAQPTNRAPPPALRRPIRKRSACARASPSRPSPVTRRRRRGCARFAQGTALPVGAVERRGPSPAIRGGRVPRPARVARRAASSRQDVDLGEEPRGPSCEPCARAAAGGRRSRSGTTGPLLSATAPLRETEVGGGRSPRRAAQVRF